MTTYTLPASAAPGLTSEQMEEFVRNHFERFVNQKDSTVAFH